MKYALLLLSLVFLLPLAAHNEQSGIVIPEQDGTNPWTHLDFRSDPDNFQFAIISDLTGGYRQGIFDDAVKKLNLLEPEFVMSVGDLIQGYTENEASLDEQWDTFQELSGGLTMPFFYVAGNHDISNEAMARKWRERFGRARYHFVYRDVLFLCLNAEDYPRSVQSRPALAPEQIGYFRDVLAKNKNVRWTLVFLHEPLWVYENENRWQEFEELLNGRKYSVFAGHFHSYAKYVRNDSNYYILATTGGGSALRGPGFGQFDHVAWVTMTGEGPKIANLLLDGIWPDDVVSEHDLRIIDNVKGDAIEIHVRYGDDESLSPESVILNAKNDTGEELKVEGKFNDSTVRMTPEHFEFSVPAHEHQTRTFKIDLAEEGDPSGLLPLEVSWTLAYDRKGRPDLSQSSTYRVELTRFAVRSSQNPITIDGALDDWSQLPFVVGENYGEMRKNHWEWNGPDDNSFRFGTAYDDEFVYIGVRATDEDVVVYPDKMPFLQDCVRIAIEARAEPYRSNSRVQEDFSRIALFYLSPGTAEKPTRFLKADGLPEGSRAASVIVPGGHTTEIALPTAYIEQRQGKPWQAFRLSIAVCDIDGEEDRGSQIWWKPFWRSDKNVIGSGTFVRE